jgi:ketosteroid isomerase-like protein
MTLRHLPVLAAALVACSPSLLPGTEVRDTRENREVYGVLRAYAVAMQTKDAAAVLALVAPDYFDGAGTPAPDDDLDRAGLERALASDLGKVDSLKLEIGVKRIEVDGDRALAQLFYDGYFRVLTPAGAVPKRQSDLHQMQLRKIGAEWKITSGL